MSIKEFNDLSLKGAEQIKITLEDGIIINGILLNNVVSSNRIIIYNLGKKTKKENHEEFVSLNNIQKVQIIQ